MIASLSVLMARDWGTAWGWVWLAILILQAVGIGIEAKDRQELNSRTGLGTVIILVFSMSYSAWGTIVVGIAFVLLFAAAVFEVVSYLSTRKN